MGIREEPFVVLLQSPVLLLVVSRLVGLASIHLFLQSLHSGIEGRIQTVFILQLFLQLFDGVEGEVVILFQLGEFLLFFLQVLFPLELHLIHLPLQSLHLLLQ